jgi:RES domain
MIAPLAAAGPSGSLYRVARRPDAWAWPPWSYAGEDGTFGNRFDDPAGEYRVLYASSQRAGAFVETLARYRTDPAIVAEYEEIATDPEDADRHPTIPPGLVPSDWCASRMIGTAKHDGPFADIGQANSLTHLRAALASRLVHYGLDDLDAGDLRRRAPHALTQEISRYVFERGVTEDGERLLGIRYLSRLGDDIENWAIFEGSDPYDRLSDEISPDDPDLLAALQTLDVVMADRNSA